MTKKYFTIIVIVSFSLLLMISLAAINAFRELNEAKNLKNQIIDSYAKTEKLLSTLEDAETGKRGYVITGEESYLKPYNAATAYLALPATKAFFAAQKDLPLKNEFAKLNGLIQEFTVLLEHVIDLRTTQGFEPAKSEITKGKGTILMDGIRTAIQSIQLSQRTLLLDRDKDIDLHIKIIFIIMLSGNITAFCLIGGCIYFIHQEMQKMLAMDKTLTELNEWQSAILNNINQAIITLDPNGDILSYNVGAESILGYPAAEMLGKSILKIFDNTNNVDTLLNLSKKMGTKIYNPLDLIQYLYREGYSHYQTTWQVRRKDKSLFCLTSTITPLTNSENKGTGSLFIGNVILQYPVEEKKLALSK